MKEQDKTRFFCSYSKRDAQYVSRIATALALTGAHVWYDDWKIRPGDSIPGAINDGLSTFDYFVLFWSEAASRSPWVKNEMDAAITRLNRESSIRVIPVLLDDTLVPAILGSIRHVDGRTRSHILVACELLGIESDSEFRVAVNEFIGEAEIEFREFPGVGVLVGCPQCGAKIANLEPWHQIDYVRDAEYVGVRCTKCGWDEGSEV